LRQKVGYKERIQPSSEAKSRGGTRFNVTVKAAKAYFSWQLRLSSSRQKIVVKKLSGEEKEGRGKIAIGPRQSIQEKG